MTTTPGAISIRSSSSLGLLDDRVHAAGGDDLVADGDVVLHRRVRALAAARGHGQQEVAGRDEDDDDDDGIPSGC